jgi:hypothetical protein
MSNLFNKPATINQLFMINNLNLTIWVLFAFNYRWPTGNHLERLGPTLIQTCENPGTCLNAKLS